jgi:hypothetical protein
MRPSRMAHVEVLGIDIELFYSLKLQAGAKIVW